MLKNVLIVVNDIEKSIEFYRDLFGLQVILQNEGNVILSEGLVLQDAGLWGKTLDEISTPFNNRMELYFEEFDIDGLLAKYESGKYFVRYATELTELAGGQKIVRLYIRVVISSRFALRLCVIEGENMQIFVDADACPVVGIVEKVAKEHNLPVTLLCDTNHVLSSDYSEVIVVGAGADAVDYKLISICHKGDIVVSQDYGVAAMALGKNAYAIHQSGKWYTNENIDQMLMERHLNKKARRASGKNHLKGPRKRTAEDNEHFRASFEKMIHMAMDKEK